MIGQFLTVNISPDYCPHPTPALCEQLQYYPYFARHGVSDLAVSIDVPDRVIIDPPTTTPHVMNETQREAMERAFWQSVEAVDEGYE